MFCVECGKEEKIFRNGVCLSCYIKKNSFTKGPIYIDIYTCSRCSSYKHKNTWHQDSFQEALKRLIKDNFQISKDLKNVQIIIDRDKEGKNAPCKVTITGSLEDYKVTEQHFLNVRVKNTICDICSKQHGGYYEAILQIRADKIKLRKEEIDAIRNDIENFVETLRVKGNRGLFITDIAEEHGGIDFYLSEKGYAYTVAKKIQEQYGGEIKQSSKNFGMKDGRQVNRMTYLLRLPAYRKYDFISLDKSYFYISSIKGNRIHVIELSTWSERVIDLKELQKAKIIGGKELIKEMILVSQTKDEIQVMNVETYKTSEVKKPVNASFDSNKVKVAIIEDNIFLLPEQHKTRKI